MATKVWDEGGAGAEGRVGRVPPRAAARQGMELHGGSGTFRAPSWLLLLFLAAMLTSCQKAPRRGFPGERIELSIKSLVLEVEVACDSLSQRQGLMHRQSLPEMSGMLFIYQTDERRQLGFWMRDTVIPLSIAFLDDNGTILQIEDMRPKDETRILSKTEVRYALEVNQGWFARHGIAVGDSFDDFRARVRHFDGP